MSLFTSDPATSPHDPTNPFISKDRNDDPLVKIGRIDGKTLVLGGSVKVNLLFQIGSFGRVVSAGEVQGYLAHKKTHPPRTLL